MTVFKVDFDVDRFQSLDTQEPGHWLELEHPFECEPMLERWKPPAMCLVNPVRRAPDLWYVGTEAAIAASAKAFKHIQKQFSMAGECLPLPAEGQQLTLLNVTECVNCLDHERSRFFSGRSGSKLIPLKYAFHKDRFGKSSIFKIPEMNGIILCLERDGDPGSEFKAAVEQHRLVGLTFEQLWNSD